MNELQKTGAYVVVAVCAMTLASGTAYFRQGAAKSKGEFSEVGKPVFPNFTDPTQAVALEVIAPNTEREGVTRFKVEYKDGVWTIPSHSNYPADGKDRLAKTASALIGIKRDSLRSKSRSEHADLGVLEPADDKSENLKGMGTRLTISGADGKPLVDLILGKAVKDRTGFRYIRVPGEDQTYVSKVDINPSIKFADWIEPDLLKLDAVHLNHLEIRKHSFDLATERISGVEEAALVRKNSTDPWTLSDLREGEEVNTDEVNKLVRALDDLKIIGVRPKPPKVGRDLVLDVKSLQEKGVVQSLVNRGFYPMQTNRGIELLPKEGELVAVTDQGIEYLLRFGDIFTAPDDELEIDIGPEKEGENSEPLPENKAGKKGRFLMVAARVNPEGLGPQPEPPVKPEPPGAEGAKKPDAAAGGDKPVDPVDPFANEAKPGEEKPAETPAGEAKPEGEKPADDKPVDDEAAKKAYEEALGKYKIDLANYETGIKAYEEKVREASKKAKELSDRFAGWYYVISGDIFDNLRQGRKTLVKTKAGDTGKPDAAAPANKPDESADEPTE